MNTADRVAQVPLWRHRIRLPDGTITPGSQDTLQQLDRIQLPDDLSGKSVLDIGCSDGFFSFECERRGAARVVAIDNFSSVYIDKPSGFRVAHELLDSQVELILGDFLEMELSELGQFDLVLFLGVMYHLRYPLLALDKLAAVCQQQIIVETEVIPERTSWKWKLFGPIVKRVAPKAQMAFLESDGINHDPTNWWIQSRECVEGMLRSCGFCNVAAVDYGWSRGTFHGYAPSQQPDLLELEDVETSHQADALQQITGCPTTDVKSLSVTDFGRFKQAARELKANRWHQHERWQSSRPNDA
jgi:tRNA (mo5U34)-methyltransferase